MTVTEYYDMLEALSQWAEARGATVLWGRIDPHRRAPFSNYVGCDWHANTAYVHPVEGPNRRMCEVVTGLIHELGHLFCEDVEPEHSAEYDWFGWEYALAKKIGLSDEDFIDGNEDYNVDGFLRTVADLNDDEFSELVRDRTDEAVKRGYIVDGKPIALYSKVE